MSQLSVGATVNVEGLTEARRDWDIIAVRMTEFVSK